MNSTKQTVCTFAGIILGMGCLLSQAISNQPGKDPIPPKISSSSPLSRHPAKTESHSTDKSKDSNSLEKLKKEINNPAQEKCLTLFLESLEKTVKKNNTQSAIDSNAIEEAFEQEPLSQIESIVEKGIFDNKEDFYSAAYTQAKDSLIKYIIDCRRKNLNGNIDLLLEKEKKAHTYVAYHIINRELSKIKSKAHATKAHEKIENNLKKLTNADKQLDRNELYSKALEFAEKDENSLVILYLKKIGIGNEMVKEGKEEDKDGESKGWFSK